MDAEYARLSGTIDETLKSAGVRIREYEENGQQVCRIFVPCSPRPLIFTARVALPGEVGKVFGKGGKFRAVAKKVAKKVVKSKVLKGMAKVIGPLSAIVPGMQPIAAGIAAATAAKKIVQAAKKGNPKAKKFAAAAMTKMNTALKTAAKGPRAYRVTSPAGASVDVAL